jgi:hypothetical protein
MSRKGSETWGTPACDDDPLRARSLGCDEKLIHKGNHEQNIGIDCDGE